MPSPLQKRRFAVSALLAVTPSEKVQLARTGTVTFSRVQRVDALYLRPDIHLRFVLLLVYGNSTFLYVWKVM